MNSFSKVRKAGIILLLIFGCFKLDAQVRVVLDTASNLSGQMVDGVFINKAIGNVEFTQNDTKIYCDSALIYRNENRVEAFGRVKIIENDSTTITARQANYDGNTKLVQFRTNVAFVQKGGVSLYTDHLDYDRVAKRAIYQNGGKLVDSTNVLESIRGYYNEYTRMASFGGEVIGTNPDWDLSSDTLQYNSNTKIIFFHAPTLLTNKDGETANYSSGSYNTDRKTSTLKIGQFETGAYILEGRRIGLDDLTKLYSAEGDVKMVAKEDEVIITGQSAIYNKSNGVTKIWDQALMKKAVDIGDTLYLKADTLFSIELENGEDQLLAYHNVMVYKQDLQGLADSVLYMPSDSMIHFFTDPILWTDGTQLTADTMRLKIANSKIETLTMTTNSFIISEDSASNYNQVKGRNMVTYFKDDQIERVSVDGNGESVYFVMEESGDVLMGMNKVICSNMLIRFRQNMVHTITFYVNNEGDFIPPHEIQPELKKLPGFDWKIENKPTLESIFNLLSPPIEGN